MSEWTRKKNMFGILLAVLLILFSGAAYANLLYREGREQIRTTLDEISLQCGQVLQKEVEKNDAILVNLATLIEKGWDFKSLSILEDLSRVKHQNPFKRMGIIFPDGTAYTTDGLVLQLEDRAYFDTAMAGQACVSDTIIDRSDGELINVHAAPIYQGEKPGAVIFATYSTESYRDALSITYFGREGVVYVVDRQGRCIIGSQNPASLREFENVYDAIRKNNAGNSAAALAMQQGIEQGENGFVHLRNGIDRVLNYCSLGVNDWVLLTVVPVRTAYASIDRILLWSYIFSAACAIIFILLMLRIQRLRERSRKELERLAFVDPITGGATAALFRKEAQHLLAQQPRRSYAAIWLDVDRFTVVNDLFGFQEGDDVLQRLWQKLTEMLGPEECAGRDTADNFMLLLECTQQHAMEQRLLNLFQQLEENCRLGGGYGLAFTAGIYPIGAQERDMDVILDRAKLSHKRAKENATLPLAFYDDALRAELRRQQRVEYQFPHALERGEFEVWYQPQYSVPRQCFAGAEALVRWREADGTLVFPDQFIPVLERKGEILKLDRYVFLAVCRQIRSWLDQGFTVEPVSVNISRLHLYDTGFVEDYTGVVAEAGIPIQLVQLELTETVLFQHEEMMSDLLGQLRQRGFRILIDDFGAGYSSLKLLGDIPVDIIKLDKSLVDHVCTHPRTRKILSGVITLARSLGTEVAAEGVETQEQYDLLAAMGCDYIQGYYCSRPIPLAQYQAYLEQAKTQPC